MFNVSITEVVLLLIALTALVIAGAGYVRITNLAYAKLFIERDYCAELSSKIPDYFQFLHLRIALFQYPAADYARSIPDANGLMTFQSGGETVTLRLASFPVTLPEQAQLQALKEVVQGPLGHVADIDYSGGFSSQYKPFELANFKTYVASEALFKLCVSSRFDQIMGFDSYNQYQQGQPPIFDAAQFDRYLTYLAAMNSALPQFMAYSK